MGDVDGNHHEDRDDIGREQDPWDQKTAQAFSQSWVRAWNAHDLDAVIGHFAEDVVFTSPAAVQLYPGSAGIVRGRAALREYWGEGLRLIPELHFDLLGVYVGVRTVVLNYRNQRGTLVNEVLTFSSGLVVEGHGTYLGAVLVG